MNDLTQLQTDFQNYILHQTQSMNDKIVATQKVNVEERLAIYANAYRYRLIDVLFEDYEKLAMLLGDEQFIECAKAYIDTYPSTFYSVRWMGCYFSGFLRSTEPYVDHPFLAELAQFEWTLVETYDARDNTPVTIGDLSNLTPDKWATVYFTFTDSLQLLTLKWNIVAVWLALNKEKDPPPLTELDTAQTWIVWRKELVTTYRALSETETWALKQARAGKSFGEICESLCQWIDEKQVAATAASLLKTWITEELIAAMSVK